MSMSADEMNESLVLTERLMQALPSFEKRQMLREMMVMLAPMFFEEKNAKEKAEKAIALLKVCDKIIELEQATPLVDVYIVRNLAAMCYIVDKISDNDINDEVVRRMKQMKVDLRLVGRLDSTQEGYPEPSRLADLRKQCVQLRIRAQRAVTRAGQLNMIVLNEEDEEWLGEKLLGNDRKDSYVPPVPSPNRGRAAPAQPKPVVPSYDAHRVNSQNNLQPEKVTPVDSENFCNKYCVML